MIINYCLSLICAKHLPIEYLVQWTTRHHHAAAVKNILHNCHSNKPSMFPVWIRQHQRLCLPSCRVNGMAGSMDTSAVIFTHNAIVAVHSLYFFNSKMNSSVISLFYCHEMDSHQILHIPWQLGHLWHEQNILANQKITTKHFPSEIISKMGYSNISNMIT